jgi:hypothetical protein
MRTKNLSPIFLLLVCSLAVASCSKHTKVEGHVRDGGGRPVEGAKVVLGYPLNEVETLSQPDGSYSLEIDHGFLKVLTLTVSKEKYRTSREKFTPFNMPPEKHSVVLTRTY